MMVALALQVAARCGSEIPWQRTLEEAQAEARRSGRPILWYVPRTEGTTMDRQDLVDDYMMMGAWMMPEVVRLVRERFVPLKREAAGPRAVAWGIERIKFVEPGLVILSPELELLHKMDGISTQNEEWLLHVLSAFVPGPRDKAAPSELARGEFAAAEAFLRDRSDPESRYQRGVVQLLTGRSDEARRTWKALAEAQPESRWAWKAAAEGSGRGPLWRGFEAVTSLPPEVFGKAPSSTHFSRPVEQVEAMIAGGVRWLLQHQRASGAWDDSTYVFGGLDSVPNVTVAVTALAAAALLEHRAVEPARVDAALARAWPYLEDEKNVAADDEDELIWAHVYRVDAFSRRPVDPKVAAKIGEIVRKIEALQLETGGFRHEYENPFATASVILALETAEVRGETLDRASRWLQERRAKSGTFSYGAGGRGGRVEGSAGRMPLCELALLATGRSDAARLEAALVTGRRHHAILEAVRKFDDHTDEWNNGGFFFWYDLYYRARAAARLAPEPRDREQKSLVSIVCSIGEIDGSWVDSHELGKSYGTAMALLVLKHAR